MVIWCLQRRASGSRIQSDQAIIISSGGSSEARRHLSMQLSGRALLLCLVLSVVHCGDCAISIPKLVCEGPPPPPGYPQSIGCSFYVSEPTTHQWVSKAVINIILKISSSVVEHGYCRRQPNDAASQYRVA